MGASTRSPDSVRVFGFCLMMLMRYKMANFRAFFSFASRHRSQPVRARTRRRAVSCLPEFYKTCWGRLHGTIHVLRASCPLAVGGPAGTVMPMQVAPRHGVPKAQHIEHWGFRFGADNVSRFFIPGGRSESGLESVSAALIPATKADGQGPCGDG